MSKYARMTAGIAATVLFLNGMPPALAATNSPSAELRRVFPSDTIEATRRQALIVALRRFTVTMPPVSPTSMRHWLDTYNALSTESNNHDVYLHVRAAEDVNDRHAATGEATLDSLVDEAAAAIVRVVAALRPAQFARLEHDPDLARRYGFFFHLTRSQASHQLTVDEARTVSMVADPVANAVSADYVALRRSSQSVRVGARGAPARTSATDFAARWSPYVTHEEAFATLLGTIVGLDTGEAHLRHYADAAASAYNNFSLTPRLVERTLEAVRRSRAGSAYDDVVRNAAAARRGVAPKEIHTWDMTSADAFTPPVFSVPVAISAIRSAERAVSPAYAAAYDRLFDARTGRVEVCPAAECDRTGFSVGFTGAPTGLFFGGYAGTVDNARALAHEAGHAVQRELTNTHQDRAVYRDAPKFLAESFAIFNELVFLDHLYKTATTTSARAYYLHAFLDDATFQVVGSAEETALEKAIYETNASGAILTASTLNTLTLKTFRTFRPVVDPEVSRYWARNRLYYTDPFYDVNYLFAGLLAVKYFELNERDHRSFGRRYLAFINHGFDDSPTYLEEKFLGIDLAHPETLVEDAMAVLSSRTKTLAHLYHITRASRFSI